MTGPAQPRRRVLVVDDSPTTRRLLKRELEKDPLIEVIGLAGDPYEARDLIVKLQPDVLTMDLEMPRMDGIQFLRRLMHYYPLPVLIFSNHTAEGSEIALETLRLGAVDVFAKPDGFNLDGYAATIQRMRSTIKEACSHPRPGIR